MAEWAETDLGYFHRRVALLMFGVGAAISLLGLVRWAGRPGGGLLLSGPLAGVTCLVRDARELRKEDESAKLEGTQAESESEIGI